MGHSQAEKAETHQRIVQVASKRFREFGLEGISIADLVEEAGLAVRDFHKHFGFRDDLVVEALTAAVAEMEHSKLTKQPTLKKGIRTYLSEDILETSCPVAAFVSDVSRSCDTAREVYTERMERSLRQLPTSFPLPLKGTIGLKRF